MVQPKTLTRDALIGAALLAAAGCASAPTQKPVPYQVAARTDAPPALPLASVPLLAAAPGSSSSSSAPPMSPAQPSMVATPSTRLNVVANGEDLSAVISKMATQVGLTAVIDPAVRGPVTRTLQNVSLSEAMQSLVGNQFRYQVQNGTLMVTPVSLVQHTYTVDYLTMSRFTTGSTVVNRGTAGSTSSNSSIVVSPTGTGTGVANSTGGLTASGADVIQSSSSVDVWGELTQQLESILFAGSTDSTSGRPNVGTGAGSRPYTNCDRSGTCLRISPLTSLVDVTATPGKQEEVANYIGLFNAAITRQVNIKAQVVEVGLDRSHTFGVDWQAVLNTAKAQVGVTVNNNGSTFPTDLTSGIQNSGTAAFNLGIGDFSVRAVLSALETVGDVTVVATPRTNALNQQRASFNVTRQEQFFSVTRTPVFNSLGQPTGSTETPSIQTVTTGLVFDVLPQISDKNIVMMAIRPSVTSLVSHTVVAGSGGTIQADLPVTDHRETDTMARVRSGETIMIGGLIQKQTSTTRTGVPVLMSMPVIGRLFSKTTTTERNTELVIFLTPEIVSGQPPGGH
jgi:MSHA type pilus biogenesis protein MshL